MDDKGKKPNFLLQRVYSDGSTDEPQFYRLEEIATDWSMGRRGFLITTAIGAGLLGSLFPSREVEAADPARAVIMAHISPVNSVVFSPDGTLLVSGSSDKSVKLWSMPAAKLTKMLTGHKERVSSVAFSPDGRLLASRSSDKTTKFWSMPGGEVANAFSAEVLLESGLNQKTWSKRSGELAKIISANKEWVSSVSSSADGRPASWSWVANTIKLWSMPAGELATDSVTAVAISPDRQLLAAGSIDKTIKLWSMQEGELSEILSGHTDSVTSLAFSPDGKLLASASNDKTIKLWSMPAGRPAKTLSGHKEAVLSVAFSPDGKLLASGAWDNTIRLWSMPAGEFLTCFFDPATLTSDKKMGQYTLTSAYGQSITYTLPCGSPLPAGAICTCDCVPGTMSVSQTSTHCTCDTICTCVPVHSFR